MAADRHLGFFNFFYNCYLSHTYIMYICSTSILGYLLPFSTTHVFFFLATGVYPESCLIQDGRQLKMATLKNVLKCLLLIIITIHIKNQQNLVYGKWCQILSNMCHWTYKYIKFQDGCWQWWALIGWSVDPLLTKLTLLLTSWAIICLSFSDNFHFLWSSLFSLYFC